MTDLLKNKVALVTGAAKGIGASCALYLAKAGASVIVADIDDGGEQVAKHITSEGGNALFQHLDVSSEASWQKLAEWIMEHFNGLDILVNNAGIALIKPLEATSLEEWQQLTRVNVDGTFLGMKHCLPALRAQRTESGPSASVINLSSAAGIVGVPGAVGYSMSKAAVRHMTKSAAMEFAEMGYNIRVNSVHPGLIETPMADDIYKVWAESAAFGTNDLEETRAIMRDMHPLKRHGLPEDIAKGVVFLASEDSSYMTGSELVIDGGYVAR